MITMTELARLAGVSQPTVSRVLNGNASVNPEVAKKVMDCVKKYNYQPNMMARSLNGSKTYLIAVIVPNIANPFFAEVLEAIEREAEKEGYSILIFNSDYREEKERKYLGVLQRYRVDGLLVAPVHANEKGLHPFRELTIPWMVITNSAENVDSVYISLEKAGYMIAQHLVSIEVEKFVFIGERTDKKFIGFEKGLIDKGIDTRQHLTVFWEEDREKMLELMLEYLEEIEERAGIFALNDMEALVVLNALIEARIAVPEKVALVGFDNTFISKRISPGITSVNQPINEMCRIAVESLLKQIKGEKHQEVQYTELMSELVVRGSSEH